MKIHVLDVMYPNWGQMAPLFPLKGMRVQPQNPRFHFATNVRWTLT